MFSILLYHYYSAEDVLDLLDDDNEGEEIFCEGSDEEFGLFDDEDENDDETIDEAESIVEPTGSEEEMK